MRRIASVLTKATDRCYCGNTINPLAVPKPGILGNCNMKCAGDPLSNCGGGKAITLYQKCSTGACTNVGANSGTSIDPIPSNIQTPSSTLAAPVKAPSSSSSVVSSSTLITTPVYPMTSTSSVQGSPTFNDALTGLPTQSTLATVKKPGTTSISQLHTRVRTSVYTSVVTETYWAR